MRACPKCGRDCGGNGGPCTPRSDPRDAEIAQLKAGLAAWKRIANSAFSDAMEHRALTEAAEAQVERLTTALKKVMPSLTKWDACRCWRCSVEGPDCLVEDDVLDAIEILHNTLGHK